MHQRERKPNDKEGSFLNSTLRKKSSSNRSIAFIDNRLEADSEGHAPTQFIVQEKKENQPSKGPRHLKGRAPSDGQSIPLQLIAITDRTLNGDISSHSESSREWADLIERSTAHDLTSLQMMALGTKEIPATGDSIEVIQMFPWDKVSDGMSATTIIAATTATIAKSVGASGMGWLIPILYVPIVTFINSELSNRGVVDDNNPDEKQQKNQKTQTNLMYMISTILTAIFSQAATDGASFATGYKVLAVTITSVAYILLEWFRVHNLSRESLYGLVYAKIKEKCGSRDQQGDPPYQQVDP